MEGGKGGKEGLLMSKQHIQKVTQYSLQLNQCFTVCPGSSDPPEKNILIYLHQNIGFLSITIF